MNRSLAPQPQEKISFDIPQIEKITLQNNVELYFIKKAKLPIVQLILFSSSGSINDPLDKKGLAFLTSLLIDEGAAEYDALQLNNELEKLGTISSINVNHDTFTFSLLSLKEYFERSLELLSKIILEPRFEEKDFGREKKRMLDKILQLKDEPSYIAASAFEKQLFGSAPYSFPEIGYESSASQIVNNDVINFYKNKFIQSNFSVIIVGNIEKEEAIELLNKYLGKLNSSSLVKNDFVIRSEKRKRIFFVDKKESAQSEIRIGNLIKLRDSEDYYAARIMNTILGGQFSSRINLNLREKRGLTYGAGSSLNYYRSAGYFEISTAVNIKNTEEAVSELLNEINLIRHKINDDEIDFAKSYLIKQFPSKFETYSQVARNISPLIVHNLPLDYYHKYEDAIAKVTKEEIHKAAIDYVLPDESIILVVGDKSIVQPQLFSLFGKELIELDIYGEEVK